MNNKQRSALLLTAMLTMTSVTPAFASGSTSMPSFSSATTNPMQSIVQEANNKKLSEGLEERRMALHDMINDEDFAEMSLSERIGFVKEYFTIRADVYKEKQRTVLSATDILQLEEMKNKIVTESDNEDKDIALISRLFREVHSTDLSKLKVEDVRGVETKLQGTIASYQELRSAGRNLEQLVNTQIKLFHSSQLQVMNKFSQRLDVNGEKEKALELNLNTLKLSNGDVDIMKKVASMLRADGKEFLFVDNRVVVLDIPPLSKTGGIYVDVSDFRKLSGFTVKNDVDSLLISSGDNALVVDKKSGNTQFNKEHIGKGITFVEQGRLYVPLHSVMSLFHFEVKWNETVGELVAKKQVYVKNELEMMKPEDFTKGIFPEQEAPQTYKPKPNPAKP